MKRIAFEVLKFFLRVYKNSFTKSYVLYDGVEEYEIVKADVDILQTVETICIYNIGFTKKSRQLDIKIVKGVLINLAYKFDKDFTLLNEVVKLKSSYNIYRKKKIHRNGKEE